MRKLGICVIVLGVIWQLLLIESVFSAGGVLFVDQRSESVFFDCEETDGLIRQFGHINVGPLPVYGKEGADISSQYDEIGISFVRTHDFFGPTDVSWIFPNWSADPLLESSYDFEISDEYVSAIVDAGCEVFYRLGESASDNESLRQVPNDFEKYAEVCKHIVMHYNDGWANGFEFDISYWEIWNEPDLSGFWNGSAVQYYELYEKIAVTLKEYDDSLYVGGPCTSSIDNVNFTSDFLQFVVENNLPLDFYSWHRYAKSPSHLFEGSVFVRQLLDSFGLTEVENINTEWNIDILTPQREKDNANNAGFTACCLSAFQDSGLDLGFRYRGPQDDSWLLRMIGFDLSLFSADGSYKYPALSYLAMNELVVDSPLRLSSEIVDPSDGFTAIAGRDEKGSNVSVLLSNFEGGDVECELCLENLPFDGQYAVAVFVIDENHHFEVVSLNNHSGDVFDETLLIPQGSVSFVRLTNSSALPSEGPNVSSLPWWLNVRLFDVFFQLLGFLLMLIVFG